MPALTESEREGVDWECPEVLSGSAAKREAWRRTCRSLPVDAPMHCYEMAVQAATLLLKEDEYRDPVDGMDMYEPPQRDRALRDTVKLRSELMKQIAVESRAATPEQRGRTKPSDPKPPKRSAGIVSLVRGKETVH